MNALIDDNQIVKGLCKIIGSENLTIVPLATIDDKDLQKIIKDNGISLDSKVHPDEIITLNSSTPNGGASIQQVGLHQNANYGCIVNNVMITGSDGISRLIPACSQVQPHYCAIISIQQSLGLHQCMPGQQGAAMTPCIPACMQGQQNLGMQGQQNLGMQGQQNLGMQGQQNLGMQGQQNLGMQGQQAGKYHTSIDDRAQAVAKNPLLSNMLNMSTHDTHPKPQTVQEYLQMVERMIMQAESYYNNIGGLTDKIDSGSDEGIAVRVLQNYLYFIRIVKQAILNGQIDSYRYFLDSSTHGQILITIVYSYMPDMMAHIMESCKECGHRKATGTPCGRCYNMYREDTPHEKYCSRRRKRHRRRTHGSARNRSLQTSTRSQNSINTK